MMFKLYWSIVMTALILLPGLIGEWGAIVWFNFVKKYFELLSQ